MIETVEQERYAGHSVISTYRIKSEMVCILMKMVQSGKVKYAKSTYKVNSTSSITPYHLFEEIQWGIRDSVGMQQ